MKFFARKADFKLAVAFPRIHLVRSSCLQIKGQWGKLEGESELFGPVPKGGKGDLLRLLASERFQ